MSKGQRHWLEEEDMFLRKHNDWPIAQLANALERSQDSIKQRRGTLHLPRRTWKAAHCKRCGQPRYEFSQNALCEAHHLEYYRDAEQRLRDRRQSLRKEQAS